MDKMVDDQIGVHFMMTYKITSIERSNKLPPSPLAQAVSADNAD